jgi:hypothetical protein
MQLLIFKKKGEINGRSGRRSNGYLVYASS